VDSRGFARGSGGDTSRSRLEMLVALDVKCPLFSIHFNESWTLSTIANTAPNIGFHENLFTSFRAETFARRAWQT
jgi:hypothetical protein